MTKHKVVHAGIEGEPFALCQNCDPEAQKNVIGKCKKCNADVSEQEAGWIGNPEKLCHYPKGKLCGGEVEVSA
jgi:hypothetical protein